MCVLPKSDDMNKLWLESEDYFSLVREVERESTAAYSLLFRALYIASVSKRVPAVFAIS